MAFVRDDCFSRSSRPRKALDFGVNPHKPTSSQFIFLRPRPTFCIGQKAEEPKFVPPLSLLMSTEAIEQEGSDVASLMSSEMD